MRRVALALAAVTWGMPAAGQDFHQALQGYYQTSLTAWANDPVLIGAVRAQNATTRVFSADQVAALDRSWQAEIGHADQPTIAPILRNPAADFLRGQVDASGGRITEVILMDAAGLNVAVTGITSDMWQGDEAKFTETYGQGPGSLHVSEVEYDESTGRYQGQISFPLVDPANGEMVGAMTVGVDAELIQ
ncbi:MAG: hypothetical protein LCH92_15180 [Proteobacteria bacterium]|nr:hypothetical protein [Pseudomonadota bacterium]